MSMQTAAETAIHQCLALQDDESCLVVTDDEREPIGRLLYDVASTVTDDAGLLIYPPGSQHGAEPPPPVAGAMQAADVVLAPTTKSLSHTRARQRATDGGARAVTLPGITERVFEAGIDTDYEAIASACRALKAQVEDARELHITAPAGTDIRLDVGERTWRLDTGIVHEPGDFSNLPAGEIFLSPTSAEGTFVVDGTMMPHGLLDEGHHLSFEVEDGYVTAISDPDVNAAVEAAADEVGQAARNLAEVGIGANVAVTELIGSVLLDEKAAGTVHIAIGDDAGFGGDTDAPIHLDGVIRNPTVRADGVEIDLPAPNE